VRESKFGRALVLETFQKSGGYILGFRVDPQEKISEVFHEIHSLFQIYSVGPLFGVDFTVESEAASIEQLLQPSVHEDTELLEDAEDTHAIAAYYAESAAVVDESRFEAVQFDERLGLAVEGLVDGITLDQLWRVM
jgi:Bardet-Biedl syndrome 5 protein